MRTKHRSILQIAAQYIQISASYKISVTKIVSTGVSKERYKNCILDQLSVLDKYYMYQSANIQQSMRLLVQQALKVNAINKRTLNTVAWFFYTNMESTHNSPLIPGGGIPGGPLGGMPGGGIPGGGIPRPIIGGGIPGGGMRPR